MTATAAISTHQRISSPSGLMNQHTRPPRPRPRPSAEPWLASVMRFLRPGRRPKSGRTIAAALVRRGRWRNHRRRRFRLRFFSTAALGLSFLLAIALGKDRQVAVGAADLPQPGDYLVDTEAPSCPLGGPIFRVTPSGQVSVVAQGGLLKKPRGNAIQDDNTMIVADGVAGLLRVDLGTGTATRIAAGPPWQPRDVVLDGQGNYLVVDWPEQSAAALARANGAPPSGPGGGGAGGGAGGPAAGPPALYRISPGGAVSVVAQGAPLVNPHGIAL